MSVFRRKRRDGTPAELWTVEATLGGVRYTLASGTRDRRRAESMDRMLRSLFSERRLDVLRRLKEGSATLPDLFPLFSRSDGSLQRRLDILEAADASANAPRLGDLVERWGRWLDGGPISRRSRRRIAPGTARRYRESLVSVLGHLGEWKALQPTAITPAVLQEYRTARQAAGITPSTVNRDVNAVGAFFEWMAREAGLLFPRPEIQREKEPPGRDRWLTADDLRRVEAAFGSLNDGVSQVRGRRSGGTIEQGLIPTRCWWPFFATLAHTGMRLGEVLALEWSDVRFTEGVIAVERGLGPGGRTKTYSSIRKVPLSGRLASLLTTHRATFAAVEGERVFPEVAFSARRLQSLWTRALKVAGIRHARLHDLRHTFAVHALEAGVSVNDLQSLLGHSDALMVLRYVRRQSEGKTAAIGDRVAASLSGELRPQEEAAAAIAREQLRLA